MNTWPQITLIGGGKPEVICDDCTREKWSLGNDDGLSVWVRLVPKEKPATEKPKPKRAPKPKKLSPWNTLLQQEGLF